MEGKYVLLMEASIKALKTTPENEALIRQMCKAIYTVGVADGVKEVDEMLKKRLEVKS